MWCARSCISCNYGKGVVVMIDDWHKLALMVDDSIIHFRWLYYWSIWFAEQWALILMIKITCKRSNMFLMIEWLFMMIRWLDTHPSLPTNLIICDSQEVLVIEQVSSCCNVLCDVLGHAYPAIIINNVHCMSEQSIKI